REVASLHLRRGYRALVDHALAGALTLIVHEEERLVLDHRPADIGAEQVEAKLRLDIAHGGRPAMRVHRVIAEKFPPRAVELVGSALYRHVHDSASAAPVLGRVAVAEHAELGDRIDRGPDDIDPLAAETGGVRVVVGSVEQVVVLEGAVAVDADGA